MLFKLTNVSKSFAAHPVLRDVSFQINPGERVGLVGRNGAGKSTVFRLVTGEETCDEGSVEKAGRLKLGLLEQHVAFSGEQTVHEAALEAFEGIKEIEKEMRRLEEQMSSDDSPETLERYADLQLEFERNGGFEYGANTESVLLGLKFRKEDWATPVSHLSGGQKNRLGMARLLLSKSDVLLLDEPTNHLDVETVEWLEDFLINREGAYVIISHDRYFLDRTCSRIIEIEFGQAFSYSGNYSKYVKEAALRKEQMQREYENQQAFISKTEAFIRKNLAGQKTKQAKSRRTMLTRLEKKQAALTDDKSATFDMGKIVRTGNDVLRLKGLSVGYPGTLLAEGIDVAIHRGDCVGVIGGNGTGKSTFLKTILGEIRELSGEILWGTKVNRGYYSQELESLNTLNEVIAELRTVAPNADNGELRSFLAAFLFVGDDVFKKVGDLSGGEKGRLALAKLIYSGANVLILDEPTNHLDILSREALERALSAFEGTIITVSHDRFFLDKIANQIIWFGDDSSVESFYGNYSEFHKWMDEQKEVAEEVSSSESTELSDSLIDQGPKREASDLSKNEIRKLKERLIEVEVSIEELEIEVGLLEKKMSDKDIAADISELEKLTQSYEESNTRLGVFHAEWEEIVEKIPD